MEYRLKNVDVLSITTLSDEMGISQNDLGTQFKRLFGVPPKELARLYPFERAIRSIGPTQPVDCMGLRTNRTTTIKHTSTRASWNLPDITPASIYGLGVVSRSRTRNAPSISGLCQWIEFLQDNFSPLAYNRHQTYLDINRRVI